MQPGSGCWVYGRWRVVLTQGSARDAAQRWDRRGASFPASAEGGSHLRPWGASSQRGRFPDWEQRCERLMDVGIMYGCARGEGSDLCRGAAVRASACWSWLRSKDVPLLGAPRGWVSGRRICGMPPHFPLFKTNCQ